MMKQLKNSLRPLLKKAPGLLSAYHKVRGIAAATRHGFPSTKMKVIGITGTNGKTTTANLLGHILEVSGAKVGMATTVNIWTGDKKWVNETKMTTLNPFALQGLLRRMANQKCDYAIVETTSHALDQHRTWGIFYDVAVFTNITQEHLDYHGTFEKYKQAKGKLFKDLAAGLRKPNMPKIAIVNMDDPEGMYFSSFESDKTYSFGIDKIDTMKAPDSSIWANNIQPKKNHVQFTLNTPKGTTEINLKMPGVFNVSNALAAASSAFALGIDLQTIKKGLENVWQLPGRMEYVPNNKGIDIIIDYAHTPDGFKQVFSTVRPFVNNRLITVFGSAGDRDKTKRPVIGQRASEFSDHIILTEEDPGSEDPQTIISEILPGIDTSKFKESDNLDIIIDRKQAIQHALSLAQPGDMVILFSMGAQTVMEKAGKKIPYNEKKVVEDILGTMG